MTPEHVNLQTYVLYVSLLRHTRSSVRETGRILKVTRRMSHPLRNMPFLRSPVRQRRQQPAYYGVKESGHAKVARLPTWIAPPRASAFVVRCGTTGLCAAFLGDRQPEMPQCLSASRRSSRLIRPGSLSRLITRSAGRPFRDAIFLCPKFLARP